jgi:hypothetical protein
MRLGRERRDAVSSRKIDSEILQKSAGFFEARLLSFVRRHRERRAPRNALSDKRLIGGKRNIKKSAC